jgi:hypothetical protein
MALTETWSPSNVEILKARYAQGAFTSVIAKELSALDGVEVTRNAVIGKIYRLQLTAPDKPKISPQELQTREHRRRLQRNGQQRVRRRSTAFRFAADRPPVALNFQIPARRPRTERIRMTDAPELPPLNLSIADLTYKDGKPIECRWITNDDLTDARFCGHTATVGSYCDHHALIVFGPTARKPSPMDIAA